MKYRVKRIDTDWSLPNDAHDIGLLDNVLQIEHTDGSIEWIPLSTIENVLIGTDQPWTKAKVNVEEAK